MGGLALAQVDTIGFSQKVGLRGNLELRARLSKKASFTPEFHLAGEWRNWTLDLGMGLLAAEDRRYSARVECWHPTSSYAKVGVAFGGGVIRGVHDTHLNWERNLIRGTFMNGGVTLDLWCDRRVSCFALAAVDRSWWKYYEEDTNEQTGRESNLLSFDLTLGVSYRPFGPKDRRDVRDGGQEVARADTLGSAGQDSAKMFAPPGTVHRFGFGFGRWAHTVGEMKGFTIPDPPATSAFIEDEGYKGGGTQFYVTYDARHRGLHEFMLTFRTQTCHPELGTANISDTYLRYSVYPWSRRWNEDRRMRPRFMMGAGLLYGYRDYSLSQYISLAFADRYKDVQAHLLFLQVNPEMVIRSRAVAIKFATHFNLACVIQGSMRYQVVSASFSSYPEEDTSVSYRELYGIRSILDYRLFWNDIEIGLVVNL